MDLKKGVSSNNLEKIIFIMCVRGWVGIVNKPKQIFLEKMKEKKNPSKLLNFVSHPNLEFKLEFNL